MPEKNGSIVVDGINARLYQAVQKALNDLPDVVENAEIGATVCLCANLEKFNRILSPVMELIKQGASIYQGNSQSKSPLNIIEDAITRQKEMMNEWECSSGNVPYKYAESNKCKQLKEVYENFKKEVIHQQFIQAALIYMDSEEFHIGAPIALVLNQQQRQLVRS